MWAVRVGIASSTREARRQARPTVVHQAFLSARSHWLPYTGLTLPRFDIPPAVRAIYPISRTRGTGAGDRRDVVRSG